MEIKERSFSRLRKLPTISQEGRQASWVDDIVPKVRNADSDLGYSPPVPGTGS